MEPSGGGFIEGDSLEEMGPYLSERQWGTVREDYSDNGDAWNYFSHDQARSRAYRWGEDGLGGISDDQQQLCFGMALWNGKDPILKERLFGLTNGEGTHGEDVKDVLLLPGFGADGSAALQPEQAQPNWFFSASAYPYIVPDSREYVQPTITMDRRRLHIEARRFYRLGKPPS